MREKIRDFDIGSVSYNVSLRPDIRQNYLKKHDKPTHNFKHGLLKNLKFIIIIIIIYYLGWTQPEAQVWPSHIGLGQLQAQQSH